MSAIVRLLNRCGVAAAVLLFSAAIALANPDRFLASIDDLPLMQGLSEESGETLVFDTPDGRIVRAAASGFVAEDAVMTFYADTLPNLGWAPLPADQEPGRLTFRRGDERLDLWTEPGAGGSIVVYFGLRPWQ